MKNIKKQSMLGVKGKVKSSILTVADERVELTNQPSDFFRIDISGIDLSDTRAIDVSFESLCKAEADLEEAMGKTFEDEGFDQADPFGVENGAVKEKECLINKAKTKGVHKRISYDCHLDVSKDDVMTPDKDKDCLFKHSDLELCNFNGVRLQFSPESNITDVLRAIDKIKTWIVNETNTSYKTSNSETDICPF